MDKLWDQSEPDECSLAEALRREAEATAPPFSPELHRRIVAGLGRTGRPRHWLWWSGLAAAVVLAAGGGLWHLAGHEEPRPVLPTVAHLPEQMATAVGRVLEEPPAAGDLGYLDDDVTRLGRFVLRHVSVSVPGRSTAAADTPG